MRGSRGFTLPELLVVIAIIAIVAAVLFPVLSAAKAVAVRSACIANHRNAQMASVMYLSDYDDHFMLVNHRIVRSGSNEVDRTWVQVLLPYITSFDIFRCPGDSRSRTATEAVIDIDLVPGDTYARYYRASLLSNLGYNYLYLSPPVATRNGYIIRPRSLSEIAQPDTMLLFVDSIRADSKSNPLGGGSYIVVPPCRFAPSNGTTRRDTFRESGNPVFAPIQGWDSNPKSELRYGMAWAYHLDRTNTVRVGGSIRPLTMKQLASGCDVRESWNGLIRNMAAYDWDMD